MDGAPQKLTDVTFDECRRGYDPEQVDAYLKKIDQAVDQLKGLLRDAVSRAEGAEARLAQARRGQSEAESARDALTSELEAVKADLAAARSDLEGARAGAGGPSLAKGEGSGALDSDELAKVLLLAQRTADQAVADAKQDAKKIVAEARAESTRLVVDAERQRDEVLKGARDEARELVDKEAAGLKSTVERLEARRDELQGDLSVLTKYVDEQRRQLAGALEKLRRVLEDPAEFRVAPAPVLKSAKPEQAPEAAPVPSGGAPSPAPASPAPAAPASAAPTAPAPSTPPAAKPPSVAKPPTGGAPRAAAPASGAPAPVSPRPGSSSGNAALAVAVDASPRPERAVRIVPDPEPESAPVAEPPRAAPDPLADTGEVAAVLASSTPTTPVATPGALEDVDADLFAELERSAGTSADQDALRAVADEPAGDDDAIRAFFDADDDPGRRWFGRRR